MVDALEFTAAHRPNFALRLAANKRNNSAGTPRSYAFCPALPFRGAHDAPKIATTIAQGVAPDRVSLVRLALREYAAARKGEATKEASQ